MSAELKKRIITSFLLVSLLILMFFYTYILIVSLIIVGVISWIEFYSLTSKIFLKKNRIQKILKFLLKAISLIYITWLIYLIVVTQSKNPELYILLIILSPITSRRFISVMDNESSTFKIPILFLKVSFTLDTTSVL